MRLCSLRLLLILLGSATLAESVLRLEGEGYARLGGPSGLRVIERVTALGGEVLSYWDNHGGWAEWEFDLPAEGTYALSFRYGAGTETRRRLDLDGKPPHPACGAVRFPATGAYTNHALCALADADGNAVVLALRAGRHVLRLTNVDSTGLALDAILVHRPDLPLTDLPLSAAAAAALAELLPSTPTTPPVNSAARLGKGLVQATFTGGIPGQIGVADTVFAVLTTGLSQPAENSRRVQTANLLVHAADAAGVHWLLITDGRAVYLIAAASPAGPAPFSLRPHAYRHAGQVLQVATWHRQDGQVCYPALGLEMGSASAWVVGGASVSALVDLRPSAGDPAALSLSSPARVTAVKLCPETWRDTGLRMTTETTATSDTLQATSEHLPGLAAFYGYATFEVRFDWQGDLLRRCELRDQRSGECLRLDGAAP